MTAPSEGQDMTGIRSRGAKSKRQGAFARSFNILATACCAAPSKFDPIVISVIRSEINKPVMWIWDASIGSARPDLNPAGAVRDQGICGVFQPKRHFIHGS